MTFRVFIIAILFLPLQVISQSGDLIVDLKFKAHRVCDSDSSETLLRYYIRKDIMRLDIKGPSANSSMIYQPKANKIWVIYRHEKLYYSMTGEEMDRLNSVVAQVGLDLKLKYDSLSEEEKKLNAGVWKDGNPIELENPEFVKIKKADSLISQLKCQKFVGKMKFNKSKVIWISDFKTMGITEADLQILNLFSAFMGKGTKALAGDLDITSFNFKKDLGGYPVLIQKMDGKLICNSILLERISEAKLTDNKMFQVPPGFSQYQNPLGD